MDAQADDVVADALEGVTAADLAEAASSIRSVIADIDAGVITASDVQRAYLAGFADGIDQTPVHDTTV